MVYVVNCTILAILLVFTLWSKKKQASNCHSNKHRYFFVFL